MRRRQDRDKIARRTWLAGVPGMTVWWSQFQEALVSEPAQQRVTSARMRSRGAEAYIISDLAAALRRRSVLPPWRRPLHL
jgi:hypothetical protein